jgi:cell division protein FtsW
MDASIYRLKVRDLLLLCVLSLMLLGVLMVQSASTRVTDTGAWDWTGAATKHMTMVGAALVAFLAVGFFNHRLLASSPRISLRSPMVWLYLVTVLLCAATLVPGVGKTVNGARRWIGAGPVQLQPSELAKWAVVLLLAWALTYRQEVRQKFGRLLLLCIAVAVPCLLVVIQDFGTAALIGMVAIAMMFAGKVKWWHLMAIVPPILAVGFWFIRHKEYRWRRMTSFMDPFADPRGEGYHMVQSLLSFASGGVLGRGLGNGVQKLGYLPEDTTDFIFAVICEELGLFGALLTIVMYLGIGYVGWQLLRESLDDEDPQGETFAKLLVFGVTSTVCIQAAINIAVATVSVPPKGMSLPLVSAGGSGLIITAAALGLLYSIARAQEKRANADSLDTFPLKGVTDAM